jgi:hypothetical protein
VSTLNNIDKKKVPPSSGEKYEVYQGLNLADYLYKMWGKCTTERPIRAADVEWLKQTRVWFSNSIPDRAELSVFISIHGPKKKVLVLLQTVREARVWEVVLILRSVVT